MVNDLTYNATVGGKVLNHLDGWVLKNTTSSSSSSSTSSAFLTSTDEYVNKEVTSAEVQFFYELSVDEALAYTNRHNADDLSTNEFRTFCNAIYLLCASKLWNKYNVRVSNEDLEDTYIQSYGGLLYKDSVKLLNRFIIQHISSYRKGLDEAPTNPYNYF